ncbi:MAG: sensor histidine kinase [Alphaproteobacteria bacterium]
MSSDWASTSGAEAERKPRIVSMIRYVQALILTRCRLCWRITAAVFIAILAIEGAILGPSIRNYEQDRLAEFSRAAQAAIDAAVASAGHPAASSTQALDAMRRLIGIAGIAGITLTDAAGRPVAHSGHRPDQTVGAGLDGEGVNYRQLTREEFVLWTPLSLPGAAAAVALVETPELGPMLNGFLWRITGLVALIAAVVTVATMLILRYLILARFIALESAVSAAAAAPQEAARYQVSALGSDELSDLTANVNRLLRSMTSAFSTVRRREEQVVQLNGSLERRVAERTVQLEAAREAAEAASRAKSEFLANMSHELRTPLNAVIGFSEVIHHQHLGPVGNARYSDYAGDILRSGRHLLQVIQDVLDLSRIEAGHLDLDEGVVDVAEIIGDALAIIAPQAAARRVVVEAQRPFPPRAICGDARRLRQVALNLLANAVSFTAAGKRVEVGFVDGADGSFALRVADQGIGIAPEDMDLVLEPFGQVSDVAARSHQGTGLGLPLTKRFLEMHGGWLELQSRPGQGTTACAWIPAVRVRAASASACPPQATA